MKRICTFLFIVIQLVAFTKEKNDSLALYSEPVVTQHTMKLNGKDLEYTATAGYLELLDETGKHKANIFYISYTKKKLAEGEKRPITFCFNGGPGSSSIWLHLGALGPKRILMTDEGNATPPPYEMITNDFSWLDMTDLVFVDPVGTGFSRPADGEKAEQFYGYSNDVKSVGEFIRLYVNRNNRWGSPKYLVGESYGTTRVAGLSKYLQDEHGMYLNGLILVSAALDFQTLREYDGNDLAHISYFPTFTAVAYYHKMLKGQYSRNLAKAIEDAEHFAYNDYALALLQGDKLDLEKKFALAMRMSELTGLSQEYIYNNNLRVPTYRFRKELLNDDNMNVGRFDARLTIYDTDPVRSYGTHDASFTQIKGAFGTCINEYVRTDLKYKNDLPFKIIGSVSPWEYANGKYFNVTSDLKQAMTVNPHLRIWVASGYYDLATPFTGTNYALSHLNIPDFLRNNISVTYYEAGHMMFLHKQSLIKLKADALKFFSEK